MIIPICPQYYAQRDKDGTWSIIDMETRKVAVVAGTVPLKRIDEATAMEIVEAMRLNEATSASRQA